MVTVSVSESIVLYYSCHDVSSRLRAILLQLLRQAEGRGDQVAARELEGEFDLVGAELRAVDPDDQPQMTDRLTAWRHEIHRRERNLPEPADDPRRPLPGDEARSIFEQWIVPTELDPFGSTSTARPQAVVVGGQPGSGKTRALRKCAAQPEFVVVNGDDLRPFHPGYADLMRRFPELMPDVTAPAAGAWIQMSLAWAASHRRNVAWETTFRSGDALLRDVTMFVDAGYDVTVTALAVPGEVSLLGTVQRLCAQVATAGAGRGVSIEGHDEPYGRTVPLLDRLAAEVPGIQVRVVDRDLRQTFPGGGTTAAEAMIQGRTLTMEAAQQLRIDEAVTRRKVDTQADGSARDSALAVLDAVEDRLPTDR